MNGYKKSMFNVNFIHKGERFVYNTKTNTLATFEKEIEDYIAKGDFIKEMLENGFIVSESEDEIATLEKEVIASQNEMPKKLEITVVLTEDCNFNCIYCYQNKGHKVFDEQDANYLITGISELFDKGLERIVIHYFGGEPLLNLSTLRYLDKELKCLCKRKGKGFESYITTNGSLLVPETLKQLEFDTIQLTFDGDEKIHPQLKRAKHSDYNTLLGTIRTILTSSKSKIKIRFNLCEENKDCFEKVIDDIAALPEYDNFRISFAFFPLRNHTKCGHFTEMTPESFAEVDYRLRIKLLSIGKKLYLPRAVYQPCKFSTGNALCIGPDKRALFCSTDFDGKAKNTLETFAEKRENTFELPKVCKKCFVAPLCLCGCKLLDANSNACITEKYRLADLLCLYLDCPDMWIE